MTKLEDYRKALSTMGEWRPYLLKNSGLPGPRGNLELAQAVAELVSRDQAEAFLSIPAERAPENSPEVFLVFCGITALGKMAARRDADALARLRAFASDERWRVREAVAIALQYFGDADMQALLHEMEFWSRGNWYEKRAAAAALAEPRLLKDKAAAVKVLYIINRITEDLAAGSDPREDSYKVLRQTLGYCWSVAVYAAPQEGKGLMEKWFASSNPDVQWIVKENLKKNRLQKMDAQWVARWQKKLQHRR